MTSPAAAPSDLERIWAALERAAGRVLDLSSRPIATSRKSSGDPVTELDLALDRLLRDCLLRPGEGWLSEETADSSERLDRRRVWIVDPLDGTREYAGGIPEWCVSVGLVEDGEAIAGGILCPPTQMTVVGGIGLGVTVNGAPPTPTAPVRLSDARVLASRSEWEKGQWAPWLPSLPGARPMGSVALKLAHVAAGLADATWTLIPKHEWDIAGGTALVRAAGGVVTLLADEPRRFNRPRPLLDGMVASSASLHDPITRLLAPALRDLADRRSAAKR